MFTEAEINEFRQDAESLMTLTVQAERPGIVEDEHGRLVPGFTAVGGPCPAKVQGGIARDPVTRSVRIGGVDLPVLEEGLHLRICEYIVDGTLQIVASKDETLAWRFRVVTAGAGADPSLVGRKYQAVSVPAKSVATARRLDVVEV